MAAKSKTKPQPVRQVEESPVNSVLPKAVAGGIVCLEGTLYYIDSVLECGLMLSLPGSNVGGLYMNEVWERPGRNFQLYTPV